jgi:hypothetical protein
MIPEEARLCSLFFGWRVLLKVANIFRTDEGMQPCLSLTKVRPEKSAGKTAVPAQAGGLNADAMTSILNMTEIESGSASVPSQLAVRYLMARIAAAFVLLANALSFAAPQEQ